MKNHLELGTWEREFDGFRYEGDTTDIYITRLGAQCASVIFQKKKWGGTPSFVSPWQGEDLLIDDPVLRSLRMLRCPINNF